MIMIYVVIKAQMPDVYAHFKLANMFSTSAIKQSRLGYCAQTLSMCIEQVIALDSGEILPPGTASDQTGTCQQFQGLETKDPSDSFEFEEKKVLPEKEELPSKPGEELAIKTQNSLRQTNNAML